MDAAWPQTWPQKAELHIFDPEGDVLLILERELSDRTRSRGIQDGILLTDGPASLVQDEEHRPLPPEAWGTSLSLVPNSIPYEPQAESPTSEVNIISSIIRTGSSVYVARPKIEEVQMRVSSKHLILASATFRISLGSEKFVEGRTLRSDGNLVLQLPGEDPDAMIILLNIIHGFSKKVPRGIDLDMLSRLAIAVNHRQMHEAVELWSETWITTLKKEVGLPNSYTPEVLLPWLFIFWVFRKDEDFGRMALILKEECDDSLENQVDAVPIGPHIPSSIIYAIKFRREVDICGILAVIHELISEYSRPNILCESVNGFSCDAKLLGSLLKASILIGIWPLPESPFPGIKLRTLIAQIRGMQVLDDCEAENMRGSWGSRSHGVKNTIETSIRSIECSIAGLSLTDFLPNKRRDCRTVGNRARHGEGKILRD